MNRRSLIGRALGALAGVVVAPTLATGVRAPSVVAYPGRVVRTEWVSYDEARAMTMQGWQEIERDISAPRVLVEHVGPLEFEPQLIASYPGALLSRHYPLWPGELELALD